MGLFSKLFGGAEINDLKSPTGIFAINNGVLEPIMTMPGNGSVNSIGESLGYPPETYHTLICDIEPFCCIAVPFKKKEAIFVVLDGDKKDTSININVINNILKKVNWQLEYDLGWKGVE